MPYLGVNLSLLISCIYYIETKLLCLFYFNMGNNCRKGESHMEIRDRGRYKMKERE